MRSYFVIVFVSLFLFPGQVLAEPIAKKELIDAEPGEGLLLDVKKFCQTHPIERGSARIDTIFKSPRAQAAIIQFKGMPLGRHYHTKCDELYYVVQGRGEIYLNGEWVPIKTGDWHICQRGVVHSVRTVGDEELWMIDVFTPPLPTNADRIVID